MKKHKWTRPSLMILTRGQKQETVLSACKTESYPQGAGPELLFSDCGTDVGDCGPTCTNIEAS